MHMCLQQSLLFLRFFVLKQILPSSFYIRSSNVSSFMSARNEKRTKNVGGQQFLHHTRLIWRYNKHCLIAPNIDTIWLPVVHFLWPVLQCSLPKRWLGSLRVWIVTLLLLCYKVG